VSARHFKAQSNIPPRQASGHAMKRAPVRASSQGPAVPSWPHPGGGNPDPLGALPERLWTTFVRQVRESYNRLEEAQRIAGLGHWSFSRPGMAGDWSDDCLRLLGVNQTALTYRRLSRQLQREDRRVLKQCVESAVRNADRFEAELRLHAGGGAIRWVRVLGQPVCDADGVLQRLHGTVMDITARKEVELRQSMEHAAARLLAESSNAVEAMPRILETLCQALGWSCAVFWQHHPEHELLERGASWSQPHARLESFLESCCQRLPLPPSQDSGADTDNGPAIQALRSGQPVCIPELARLAARAPCPRRLVAARRAGLHALLAFPIGAGRQIFGVVELFASQAQHETPGLLDSLEFIGRHIGQIMQRDQAQRALRESEAHFRALVEQASDSFYVHDAEGRFIDVNQRGCDSLGYTREQLLALHLHDIDIGMPVQRLAELLGALKPRGSIVLESRYRRRDGSVFPVEIRIGPIQVNGRLQLLSLVRDVTERKKMQEHIRHLAYHDPLTDLPNRTMFNRHLDHALAQANRHGRNLAVLFIDLDRFKNINDTLGHDAGDRLLQEMARRLSATLRAGDLVARLGGDEFVVLIEESSDVTQVARHILAALVREYMLDGQLVHITASIGISCCPADGQDAFSLMKNADIAMYRAKESGKNTFHFYSEQTDGHSASRLALEASLRRAIARNELLLHYQAKVDALSGRICGVEVLARWAHPELGVLAPDQFIPLAEETGLIVPLTKAILQQACHQYQVWIAQGLPPLRIAVNLSARNFSDEHLATEVAEVLAAAQMPPQQLELEITESMMMRDTGKTAALMLLLKKLGVHISVDDFGTGYSSLSQLKHFPIDTIKIDRCFITGIPHDQHDQAIVAAIIAMGKSLRVRVVAEGVESAEQVQFLRRMECDELQGYYFGKPVPAEEFGELLQENLRLALLAPTCVNRPRGSYPTLRNTARACSISTIKSSGLSKPM